MAKKEILTNDKIEKDIITAIKKPPNDSERTYKRTTYLVAIIAAIIIVVTAFISPELLIWEFLALLMLPFVYVIFLVIQRKIKINKVAINDYSITTEIVHSTAQEHFSVRTGKHRVAHIDNYILRFENGKSWRVPKDNYLWSVERPMSDFAIYESTHRKDSMIVVTKKNSGEIVMAYHTDFFEYRN